jgi:hypothetical protein
METLFLDIWIWKPKKVCASNHSDSEEEVFDYQENHFNTFHNDAESTLQDDENGTFKFLYLALSTTEEDCINGVGFFSDDVSDDSSSISGAALDELIW